MQTDNYFYTYVKRNGSINILLFLT